MKKIYSSGNRYQVWHVKNILENEGIACTIKNELLATAMGELPPIECWLEVWLTDTSQYEQAEKIIRKNLSEMEIKRPDWTCSKCGEELEHQFTTCWSCGTAR